MLDWAQSDPATARTAIDRPGVSQALDQLRRARGRESFETGVGFTIVGARIRDAIARDYALVPLKERGIMHLRCERLFYGSKAASAVIRFDDGFRTAMLICVGLLLVGGALAAIMIGKPDRLVELETVDCKPHCAITGPAVQPRLAMTEGAS
jgi:hypothetical protein